jgi:cytoskeletal protein RodZ
MNMLNFEQDRANKLAEMGSELRRIREEKAISLEHVSAKTMIQPRLLNAIEEGKLDQLPEPVYIQGFIRRFADVLGLNGVEFAQAFPTNSNIEPHQLSEWQELPAGQLRPFHLYLLYIAVILAAVSGLSYLVNRPTVRSGGNSQTTTIQPTLPVNSTVNQRQPQTSTPASARPLSTTASSAKNTATPSGQVNQPVQVKIILTQASWMQIVADGKTEYEGTLPAGTQKTLAAKEKLTIKAGNAKAVLVAINNAQAKPMGKSSTVEELTVEAESSASASPQPAGNSTTGE